MYWCIFSLELASSSESIPPPTQCCFGTGKAALNLGIGFGWSCEGWPHSECSLLLFHEYLSKGFQPSIDQCGWSQGNQGLSSGTKLAGHGEMNFCWVSHEWCEGYEPLCRWWMDPLMYDIIRSFKIRIELSVISSDFRNFVERFRYYFILIEAAADTSYMHLWFLISP